MPWLLLAADIDAAAIIASLLCCCRYWLHMPFYWCWLILITATCHIIIIIIDMIAAWWYAIKIHTLLLLRCHVTLLDYFHYCYYCPPLLPPTISWPKPLRHAAGWPSRFHYASHNSWLAAASRPLSRYANSFFADADARRWLLLAFHCRLWIGIIAFMLPGHILLPLLLLMRRADAAIIGHFLSHFFSSHCWQLATFSLSAILAVSY